MFNGELSGSPRRRGGPVLETNMDLVEGVGRKAVEAERSEGSDVDAQPSPSVDSTLVQAKLLALKLEERGMADGASPRDVVVEESSPAHGPRDVSSQDLTPKVDLSPVGTARPLPLDTDSGVVVSRVSLKPVAIEQMCDVKMAVVVNGPMSGVVGGEKGSHPLDPPNPPVIGLVRDDSLDNEVFEDAREPPIPDPSLSVVCKDPGVARDDEVVSVVRDEGLPSVIRESVDKEVASIMRHRFGSPGPSSRRSSQPSPEKGSKKSDIPVRRHSGSPKKPPMSSSPTKRTDLQGVSPGKKQVSPGKKSDMVNGAKNGSRIPVSKDLHRRSNSGRRDLSQERGHTPIPRERRLSSQDRHPKRKGSSSKPAEGKDCHASVRDRDNNSANMNVTTNNKESSMCDTSSARDSGAVDVTTHEQSHSIKDDPLANLNNIANQNVAIDSVDSVVVQNLENNVTRAVLGPNNNVDLRPHALDLDLDNSSSRSSASDSGRYHWRGEDRPTRSLCTGASQAEDISLVRASIDVLMLDNRPGSPEFSLPRPPPGKAPKSLSAKAR